MSSVLLIKIPCYLFNKYRCSYLFQYILIKIFPHLEIDISLNLSLENCILSVHALQVLKFIKINN